MPIDMSPLFNSFSPPPSATQQMTTGIGNMLDVFMQRRAAQQAEDEKLRQQRELHDEQIAATKSIADEQNKRLREEYAAKREDSAAANRVAMGKGLADVYEKNRPELAPLVAGTYGGSMAPVPPPEQPPPPTPIGAYDASHVDENAVPPPSATPQPPIPAGPPRMRVTLPGSQPFDFAEPQKPDYGSIADRFAALNPNNPGVMRATQEARIAEENPNAKTTLEQVNKERDRQATMERARMARANASGGGGLKPNQEDTSRRGYNTEAYTMLNQALTREDYKDTVKELADNKIILDGLMSDNVAGQKRAVGLLTKQGAGPGSVQEAERVEFARSVGGMGQAVVAWANKWLGGGEVPEEQRKIFASMMRDIVIKNQTQKLQGIQDSVTDMFASHPDPKFKEYAGWASRQVGQRFLGKAAGGASPAPGKKPAPTADDDARLKAMGF